MFNEELNQVKKELSSKAANTMLHQPKYAGAAHWARCLKHRIDIPMEVRDVRCLKTENSTQSKLISVFHL